MNRITRELAAKAAEVSGVSEQNRDVWMAGFAAGFLKGRMNAYAVVAKSCADFAQGIEAQMKSETTEE